MPLMAWLSLVAFGISVLCLCFLMSKVLRRLEKVEEILELTEVEDI